MTLDEARDVAGIVETAEGGCGGCVNEAVAALNAKFPAFLWATVQHEGYAASVGVERRTQTTPEYVHRPSLCPAGGNT